MDLSSTQLAPAGFLLVEWAAAQVFGPTRIGLRLVPMLAGIASLFLFARLARRTLSERGAWIALLAFAANEDLIGYGAQIKQYSTDVLAALIVTTAALDALDRPLSARRWLALAAGGMALVWFAHPVAFVLAGVGLVGWADAVRHRRWGRALAIVGMALTWLASFALVYRVGLDQLGHRRGMWAFWNFAFPPLPPRSLDDLAWPLRRFLYLFVNPLNFGVSFFPRVAFLPACLMFFVGAGSLARRRPIVFWVLMSPLLIHALAACLRLYPFHGRLILYLVPALLIPIAEGLESSPSSRVRQRPAWRYVLLASVLLDPVLSTTIQIFSPETVADFNPLWGPSAGEAGAVEVPRPERSSGWRFASAGSLLGPADQGFRTLPIRSDWPRVAGSKRSVAR